MEINKYIENTISQIKAERDREIAVVKQRITAEKIAPANAEVDKKKNESVVALNSWFEQEKSKLTLEFNAKMQELQKKYEGDRNSILDGAEKKKQENAETIITMETCEINGKYEKAIAQLTAILEVKE